jgi:hypothetical protein
MTDPFKPILDNLIDSIESVAAQYNDGAVTDSLSIAPPVLQDIKNINRTDLFDNSDKAFVDDTAIADEIAFEIVEEFNK